MEIIVVQHVLCHAKRFHAIALGTRLGNCTAQLYRAYLIDIFDTRLKSIVIDRNRY